MVKTEDGGKTASCTVTVKAKIIPVESITLDQSEKTLNIGETVTLKATVSPENATNKNISWSSDKTDVATVDGNGNVSANSVGTATIKATAGDKSDTCTIKVNPIKVTGVKILDPPTEVTYGESLTLKADVSPENATDKSVTWTSDEPSIATITNDGVVAIYDEGIVVFTVTTNDGEFTDSCTINIKKPETVIPVTSVSLNKTTLTLDKEDSETLTASVLPTDATNQAVTWSTSSDAVATVDSNGKVTAVGRGEASITATSADNTAKKATCKVTVNVPVTGVSLDESAATLSIKETLQLNAKVSPEDASNSNVTWKSNDPTVATVSDSGLVTAIAKGNATIIVETEDGKKKDICKVTVSVPVESVSVNPATAELIVDKTLTLEAEVRPKEANQGVVWSSTDDKVATVDEKGIVTARAKGTATITATADGGKKASCKITVGTDNDGILTYSFNDGSKKATIVGYEEAGITNAGGKVTIPAKYMGYEVTEIASETFAGCTALTELTIEGSVDIREYAFQNCEKLGSVNLGEKVTAIRYNAFEGCSSLNEIVIPNSVTSIGSDAFRNCSNLTEVTIGSGIVYAADASSNAFLNCPITSFDCNSLLQILS